MYMYMYMYMYICWVHMHKFLLDAFAVLIGFGVYTELY